MRQARRTSGGGDGTHVVFVKPGEPEYRDASETLSMVGPAAADDTLAATLVGSREPGIFSRAFFVPAVVWDQSRTHIADAHVIVASGAVHFGDGEEFLPTAADRSTKGSFLLVPAGAVPFDGATEDTILIGTSVAPWATDSV